MSFNLIYNDKGIDLSGFGAGIARGIEQAALLRKEREKIVSKEIDDFKSNYDTSKIMAKDVPLFATAFDQYRKTAIDYSKLNRGGANTEKLSAKKIELDNARNSLNKIYTDSAKSASVLDGLVKTADKMLYAGYALPDDMNQDIIRLKTQPVNQIDFDKLKSPTAYNFKANEKDFTVLDSVVKTIKENKGSIPVQGTGFTVDLGEKDKPGYQSIQIPETEHFTIKDQYAVLNRVTDSLNADALLKNAAIDQKASLIGALTNANTDTDSLIKRQLAKKTADKITAAYPELENDISKATPAMIIAANRGYLDRNTLGTSVSMKEFNAKLSSLKLNMNDKATQARLKLAKDRILGKNAGVSAGMISKIVEYGGALWDDNTLSDMGFTREKIQQARDAAIQFNALKGYRPGFLNP